MNATKFYMLTWAVVILTTDLQAFRMKRRIVSSVFRRKFGRDKFDPFVRNYFDSHAFQSITTETFRSYLKTNLLDKYPNIVSEAEVDEWIEKADYRKPHHHRNPIILPKLVKKPKNLLIEKQFRAKK